MTIEVKLAEGYYSSDHKTVSIVNAKTKETIADGIDVNYAKLIIKAVNESKEGE